MARYLALVFILLGAPAAAADTCSDLATNLSVATLPNTTITSAATVSGAFTPPNGGMPIEGLPSFCRVTATLKPRAASDIKIEIWMPSSGWNGKFEAVGNGGLGGTISYTNLPNYLDHASLADAIMSGYAGASTDTGHVSSDRTWLANEEKEKDYGYRAIHEMTLTAKAVIPSSTAALPRVPISMVARPAAGRHSEKRSSIPKTMTAFSQETVKTFSHTPARPTSGHFSP